MEKFLNKKYKLKTSENFEEYLKNIGIGLISRMAATSVSPTVRLESNPDGSITFTMSSPIKNIAVTFRMDEEFVEERADGVKVKSIFILSDGKLIQTQTEKSGRISTHVRDVVEDLLIVTSTVEGWEGRSVRTYQLVK